MLQLVAPYSLIITGPSGAGKSSLVGKLIQNEECTIFPNAAKLFDHIYVVYRSKQPLYNSWAEHWKSPVTFLHESECPSTIEIESSMDGKSNTLFIFDDIDPALCDEKVKSLLRNLFSRLRHHKNISVCLLLQTLFDSRDNTLRFLHRNASYIVLFKYPRDVSQLRCLVSQMYALTDKQKFKNMLNSLQHALMEPYSYLLFDCSQNCPDLFRIRQNIACESNPPYTWILAFPEAAKVYKYKSNMIDTVYNHEKESRYSSIWWGKANSHYT